jgi:hypothetical protein
LRPEDFSVFGSGLCPGLPHPASFNSPVAGLAVY